MICDRKTLDINYRITDAAHRHAGKCVKPLDECKVCKVAMDYFANLNPFVLSACLSEPRDRPVEV
jgi:hypothetical protein